MGARRRKNRCTEHGNRCLLQHLPGWKPGDCQRLFLVGLIALKREKGWPESVRHVVPPPPRRGGEKRLRQYESHFHELYSRIYGERCDVVQEFKNPRAKLEWSGYKVLADGREGPTPESVATSRDRSRYCQQFGFSEE